MFIKKLFVYVRHERFEILREILFSVIISSIVTIVLTTYLDEQQDKRVASRQFIYQYSRTFFDQPKYRDMSIALESNYLYGDEIKQIDRDHFSIGDQTFSEYDLDDYLGLLGDMYTYYKAGFISRDLLDTQYAYYICIAYKSSEVQSYRGVLSGDGFSQNISFSFLDDFADELNLRDKDCKDLQ